VFASHHAIGRRNSLQSDTAEAAADAYADSALATADNNADDDRGDVESLLDDNTTRRNSTLGGLLGVFKKGSRVSGSLSTDSSDSSSSSSSSSGGVSHSSSHSSLSEVELQDGELGGGASHPLIQTVDVVTEVRAKLNDTHAIAADLLYIDVVMQVKSLCDLCSRFYIH
jgi:hypothetical protein